VEQYRRPATLADLKALVSSLNQQEAEYLLIGGYALFAHGLLPFGHGNAHDTGYKLLFSTPELVRDLILGFVPDEWLHQPRLQHPGESTRQLRHRRLQQPR
jgi:hypothetical protein